MPDSSSATPAGVITPQMAASTPKQMSRNDKLVLGALAAFAVVALIFGGYYFFVQVKPKAVSIVNYFAEPLTVEVNGQEYEVRPFENFATEVTTSDSITVKATNEAGDVVHESTQKVGQAHGVLLHVMAPEEDTDADLCFAQADMADLFYRKDTSLTSDNIADLKSVQILTTEPGRTYYHQLGAFFGGFTDTWVFPGRLNYDDLPAQIDEGDDVTAFFYFSCEDKDDIEALSQTAYSIVQFETNFEESLQEYYDTLGE